MINFLKLVFPFKDHSNISFSLRFKATTKSRKQVFLEKINKIDKPSCKLRRKEKKFNIRNERGEIKKEKKGLL